MNWNRSGLGPQTIQNSPIRKTRSIALLPSTGTTIEKKLKRNKQYSARLTRRQHRSANKLTDFISCNQTEYAKLKKNLRRRLCHQHHRATRKSIWVCDRIGRTFNQSGNANADKTANNYNAKKTASTLFRI